MVIGPVVYDEPKTARADASARVRIRRSGADHLPWARSCDLLLFPLNPEPISSSLPRPAPPSHPVTKLWIPFDETSTGAVNPIVSARISIAGNAVRATMDSPCWYVPDLMIRSDSRAYVVMGDVATLDASSRNHLRKKLERLSRPASHELFDRPAKPDPPEESSPAAASLLERISRAELGDVHAGQLEKDGSLPLLNELSGAGRICVLLSGQIVTRPQLDACLAMLSPGQVVTGKDTARIWETSVGLAKQILRELCGSGSLDSLGKGTYKVRHHAA